MHGASGIEAEEGTRLLLHGHEKPLQGGVNNNNTLSFFCLTPLLFHGCVRWRLFGTHASQPSYRPKMPDFQPAPPPHSPPPPPPQPGEQHPAPQKKKKCGVRPPHPSIGGRRVPTARSPFFAHVVSAAVGPSQRALAVPTVSLPAPCVAVPRPVA